MVKSLRKAYKYGILPTMKAMDHAQTIYFIYPIGHKERGFLTPFGPAEYIGWLTITLDLTNDQVNTMMRGM